MRRKNETLRGRIVLNPIFRWPSTEISYLSSAFNFPLTSSLLFSRLLSDQVDEALRPRAGPFDRAHGPEYVEWASRARSDEQDASKGSFIHIVPLNPAYPALAGRGTFRPAFQIPPSPLC